MREKEFWVNALVRVQAKDEIDAATFVTAVLAQTEDEHIGILATRVWDVEEVEEDL